MIFTLKVTISAGGWQYDLKEVKSFQEVNYQIHFVLPEVVLKARFWGGKEKLFSKAF